jgi:O-antigen/teichoic acid export membrane protein
LIVLYAASLFVFPKSGPFRPWDRWPKTTASVRWFATGIFFIALDFILTPTFRQRLSPRYLGVPPVVGFLLLAASWVISYLQNRESSS